jgi:hypothetical protein
MPVNQDSPIDLIALNLNFLHQLQAQGVTATVALEGNAVILSMPVPTTELTPPRQELEQCAQDILTTLREAGHRLTTDALVAEMKQRDREWSKSKVGHLLPQMRTQGLLTYDARADPKGFGLPEWS